MPPANANSLGPFTPVVGSSSIYTLVRKRGTPSAQVYTLCSHLPLGTPVAHTSTDPHHAILNNMLLLANTGRQVWGICQWGHSPDIPGHIVGVFSDMIAFGCRRVLTGRGRGHVILDVDYTGPDTSTLLRPVPDYLTLQDNFVPLSALLNGHDSASLLADLEPHATVPSNLGFRHYPWTNGRSTSPYGVLTYIFYDWLDGQPRNPPSDSAPYAGMNVVFRPDVSGNQIIEERATPVELIEIGATAENVRQKFRGWVTMAEVSVILDRLPQGVIGTILEAHPGVLPDGKACTLSVVQDWVGRFHMRHDYDGSLVFSTTGHNTENPKDPGPSRITT
ncbi:hypothetical protein BJ508DRAFT_314680 [Ascobolus immersus RN42]|uniref:Uncharacterized protein n=1 Tax=Ascobolus immersus RN42 TaxID=1160509 RepID=A0A3N4HK11_ASCIM|nr:hypothetical protein BJ508DRAFT_314680 [Ascobolus immersus RN42]